MGRSAARLNLIVTRMSLEINLLPFSRRRILHRLYIEESIGIFFRRLLVMTSFVTAAAVLSLAVIVFSTRLTSTEVDDTLAERVASYQNLRGEIALQNQALQEMKEAIEQKIEWSAFFQDTLEALPPGTVVREMSGDNAARRVSISGTAAARSSLIVLEDRLRALAWVAKVEAPHSNLLERVNPPFSFTLTLKENLP